MLLWLQWRRFRTDLVWVFLPVLAMLLLTVHQHPLKEPIPVYRSVARLLLSPNSRGGDWEFNPVTDPRTIREILNDQQLLERAVSRSGLPVNWIQLASLMQIQTSGHLENKADVIEIALVGPDPDQLGKLNASLVSGLIERLRELTVAEQDKTIKYLRSELKRAQEQVFQSYQQLKRCPPALSPAEATRLDRLRADNQALERDVLKVELDSEPQLASGPLEQELERQSLELAALRNLYLERALPVQAQSARLRRLQQLVQQRAEQNRRVADGVKRAKSQRLRRELARVRRELATLEASQPRPAVVLRRAALERELGMWQANLSELQGQLMQARYKREQHAARLNVVIVEKPQKGVAVTIPSFRRMTFELCCKRLPASLFIGLVLVFALHFLKRELRIERRIEEAMDLPILGRIPPLPRELAREWERIKHRRTQEVGGG